MTRPPVPRQRFGFWFWAGAICLVPAAMSFFSDTMAWNLSDHASFALLIMSGAALWRLVRPALGNRRQRFFAAVAVVGTGALIWVNLAAGLIGQESAAVNRIFWAVPALLLIIFAALRFNQFRVARRRHKIQSSGTLREP